MSDNVLKAACLFVAFMATPRMQAVVVGSEDSLNVRPRYLLSMSKNAYNEPILVNDRFYQQCMLSKIRERKIEILPLFTFFFFQSY
jgi:hypothetical protein